MNEKLGTIPDVVLLHNPEFILSDFQTKGTSKSEAEASFYEQMGESFNCLENLKELGLLSTGYGVSSNLNGCKWSVTGAENDYESVSLKILQDQVTSSFMCAQVPLNLLESGIVTS